MDNKNKTLDFNEDSFDISAHKRAAMALSRKKADAKRTKRNISFGKVLLTIVALVAFILLFFGIMNLLGLGPVPVG